MNIFTIMIMNMTMTMMAMVVVVVNVGPLPFEEKEGTSPPALLLNLVGLLQVVFGNGFLKLEVDGVYGSCRFTLVLPCFF